MRITLTVNGATADHEVAPNLLLSELLREHRRLTGVHIGCDTSQCGACNILVDDTCVKACTMLAVQADGARIITIEGLASGEALHPMQVAFREHHGLQCGFCTPGMILSGIAIARRHGTPSAEVIREELDGNLCRCTGYINIVKAIEAGARAMAEA